MFFFFFHFPFATRAIDHRLFEFIRATSNLRMVNIDVGECKYIYMYFAVSNLEKTTLAFADLTSFLDSYTDFRHFTKFVVWTKTSCPMMVENAEL